MKPSATPPEDFACACATARQVARVLTHLYDARLKPAGLEAPQFALLMTLKMAGPSNQTDLSRRCNLDKTTISRNLRLLEQKGWLEPSDAPDKRVRRFALTPQGRQRLTAARPAWNKLQAQLRTTMSPEIWDAMFELFATLTESARTLSQSDRR